MLGHTNFNPSYDTSSVTATFEAVFRKLDEEEPDASRLFALLSFFDPEHITTDILTGNADQVRENDNPLYQVLKYTLNFERSVSQLRQLSLQRFTRHADEPKALWIHDLVQELYRDRMAVHVQRECLELAVTLLHSCYPDEILDMNDTSNWRNYEKCLPHIFASIKHAEKLDSHSARFACLCRDAGWFFYHKGQYDRAVDLASTSISLLETCYGIDNDEYISAVNLLAAANHTRGNFKVALKWYFTVLSHRQRKYGLSENTANTMHNIALCYHEGGEYEEAQRRFEEVLAYWTSTFSPDDQHSLMTLLSMSRNIRYRGDFALAEANLVRCKAGLEKQCGPKHIFTLVALSELASAIWRRDPGRLAEAEAFHRQALVSKIAVLGEEHIHTWDSYADIGYMLLKCDPSRQNEGERLVLKALESYVDSMGIDNSQAIEFYQYLEEFYQQRNETEKLSELKTKFGTPKVPSPILGPTRQRERMACPTLGLDDHIEEPHLRGNHDTIVRSQSSISTDSGHRLRAVENAVTGEKNLESLAAAARREQPLRDDMFPDVRLLPDPLPAGITGAKHAPAQPELS